ncbi:MAG: CDP-alcohol phosphatidyltransferase family protein [Anaerolineae bacterium]|nr:MAG: CDP-alcohol phosphatidyltransferase family protein [Anaerolineae bacterium]
MGQKTGGSLTLTDRVRGWVRGVADPIADLLARLGFTPNTLTLIGFLMNVAVAVILSRGEMRWGAVAYFLASAFDGLDGAVARRLNRVSRFGAFLDSTVDRLSEAAVFLGLLVWYTGQGAKQEIVLIYATIVGSLMVSYSRARAEGLGLDCRVGLLTRMERFIVLFVGLFLERVTITLWVMAVLTNFTALQRMVYVWRRSEAEEEAAGDAEATVRDEPSGEAE